MQKTPLVSVIIIFFNTEKYFEEAINSVLDQTFRDFELLLVDDGSTDKSTKIAKSYADKYQNYVRYLEHKNHQNRGISATRNLGISVAKGKYISFLDADDVWFPHSLAEQITTIESYPDVAIVYGGIKYWHSWTGKQNHKEDTISYPLLPFNTVVKPPTLFPTVIKQRFTPLAMICRRNSIEKIRGYENSFKGSHEDHVFFIKLSLHFKAVAVNKCWHKYRQHNQSSNAVKRRQGKAYKNCITFLLWIKQYLIKEKIHNPRVWLAYHKEFLGHLKIIYEFSNQPTYRWCIWYVVKLIIKPFLVASSYQKFVKAVENGR